MSFNYKIFNDMSAKLKAAEANVDEVRKRYEAKISAIVEEYETKLLSAEQPVGRMMLTE